MNNKGEFLSQMAQTAGQTDFGVVDPPGSKRKPW